MPLAMAKVGQTNTVLAITGRDEVRQRLAQLGFVAGCQVSVVNEMAGNLILNVKGARVALSKSMAARILVE